jgi:hypothetical protein
MRLSSKRSMRHCLEENKREEFLRTNFSNMPEEEQFSVYGMEGWTDRFEVFAIGQFARSLR